jgi:hypothetical protein
MEGRVKNTPQSGTATESLNRPVRPRKPTFDEALSPEARFGRHPVAGDCRPKEDETTWRPREYHWVVKIGGQVIGEVDLVHDSQHTALLRRLRIDPAWQRTAALSRLIECVRQFCWKHGRLQLNLEPGCAPRWMLHMLQRRGLQLSSRWQTGGQEIWKPQPRVDHPSRAYHWQH